ncbi:polysaccharide deacetylase family protein [Litoribacillus peritrichatus]|uniref:Polysaccharide deacetylase family protein n=1 Tax=Litoribacillus peritrichatus TaxID=718191 RepID=A0ABP7MX80_9GAMM
MLLLSSYQALAFEETNQSAVILQYHHVSNDTPFLTSISPKDFKSQMTYLKAHDFNVIPVTELVRRLRAKQAIDNKTVVITFDDAYNSVYDIAWPVLKAHGFPFSVYVNTESIDNQQKHSMSWAQISEMAEAGVEFANHSHTHLHMIRQDDKETETQWLSRLESEIDRSEALIQRHTKQSHKILAYPFGEYNPQIQALLLKKTYVGLAQHSGAVASNTSLQSLPRFPFGGYYTDLEDFKLKVNALGLPVQSVQVGVSNVQELAETLVKGDEAELYSIKSDWTFNYEEAKPFVLVELAITPSQYRRFACYATGLGKVDTSLVYHENNPSSVYGVAVNIKNLLQVGRSRINCTLPSKWSGRFYWFSQPFIRKAVENAWYAE